MWTLLILVLILVNGLFSAAEIAVVTARKTQIRNLAEKGDERAKILLRLQSDPEPFLATVQIGVTLLSSAASALGGVSAVGSTKPIIDLVPFLQPYSTFLSVALVVILISYTSLILGELVPKSLALKYPNQIALAAAQPLELISRFLHPFVTGLTTSIRLFVKPIAGKTFSSHFTSEEEIIQLLKDGRDEGIIDPTEHELIRSVFDFNDISVKEVMVPRPKIHALQIDMPADAIQQDIAENMFSRYPVYRGDVGDIAGVVYFKDMLADIIRGKPLVLKTLLRPAYFVPETMQVSRLLKELQRRRIQMAIIVNEYGSVEGLVTMEDLVEEIVGEIRDEYDLEERPVERLKDGTLLIDASLFIRDLNNDYDFSLPESADYETLGGFVLSQLQDMPKGGEIIQYGDYTFTIVDMEARRIAKLKVETKPSTLSA
jgi:putative hemolysin